MRLLQWSHDGGEKSGVRGFFLVEIKGWFSIVILKFNSGTREAYHNHAFNAYTWWLKGDVVEEKLVFDGVRTMMRQLTAYTPSLKYKYTPRDNMHRIRAGEKGAWAISFRGPWLDFWKEVRGTKLVTLTHERKVVSEHNVGIQPHLPALEQRRWLNN